jgi:NAD(P)H-hydrate epimerase
MKLVSVEEMRAIEQAADAAGQSYGAMMDMAGQAVAMLAQRLVLSHEESEVLVLVGPGNNGGDGLVVARYLLEMDQHVTVYVWKRDIKGDENFRVLKRKRRGIAILWADNDAGFAKLREEARRADLIVDALLGTGAARPIEGTLAEMLLALHEVVTARRTTVAEDDGLFTMGVPRFPMMEAFTFGGSEPGDTGDWGDDEPFGDEEDADSEDWLEPGPDRLPWPQPTLLAVDCATGLNCDTGAVDPATLPADLTVTFGFPKWGHVQFPGAGMSGLLAVADIGVPPQLATSLTTELLEPALVRRWLPARPPYAHKGTFGKVMVAAGSLDYTGAALLSATAAIRAGAGLVTLAIPGPLHAALAGSVPEATWVVLPGPEGTHTAEGGLQLVNRLEGYDALLVGPGLTNRAAAVGFVQALFDPEGLDRELWTGRVVADADALNILATMVDVNWPNRLPPLSILTPHPGEMARLTGLDAHEINARRIETARRWAGMWGHVVLLKGPYTVIAEPGGRTAVLPFALPALATAGSGDVLAGAIASMLAQGLQPFEEAACGE